MKVYFNEDDSHFFSMLHDRGIDPTPEVMRSYLEAFRGTDVTDFVIAVIGTCASFESKVVQNYCDKYEHTEEDGIPVDYRDTMAKIAYEIYRVHKFDHVQVWIEALREMGITPWASIRMNDAHCLLQGPHVVKNTRFYEHPEQWRVTEKPADGYYDRCFNYLLPEVRAYYLSFIEEVLGRYDIDGLELDFSREHYCFPVGMEWQGRPVMNAFIEDVRSLIRHAEEERGHKIRLSALVWDTPSGSYQMGLDVYHWINKGLVDMIRPNGHFLTTNFDMPIEEWRALIDAAGTHVELAAGHEELVTAYPGARMKNSTVAMAMAQAAANISKGADSVYLFNYMAWDDHFASFGWDSAGDVTTTANQSIVLHNIGSMEKILKQKRTSVLTFSSNTVYWMPFHHRLPMWVGETRPGDYFRIATGPIATETAELIVGMDFSEKGEGDLTVYCNGKPTEALGECDFDPAFRVDGLRYFKFRLNTEGCGNTQVLHIYSTKTCWLKWAQIDVIPSI